MNLPCGNPGGGAATVQTPPGGQGPPLPSQAQIDQVARVVAKANYSDYAGQFLYPSDSLMIKSGLWLELEVVIGFVVGLGLGSLIGQRTVAVILMIVLEVILTPILSRANLPHLLNLQRAVVGLATAHLAPGGLPVFGGGGGGPGGGAGNPGLVPESTTVADLRHRGLAGGLVDPRGVEDDEAGRLILRCGRFRSTSPKGSTGPADPCRPRTWPHPPAGRGAPRGTPKRPSSVGL